MSKWSEQYKDPRWQKKRLEILERDEWRCQWCHSEEKQLNVHHNYYKDNAKVWEYGGIVLTTLCHECHERAHRVVENMFRHKHFYMNLIDAGLKVSEITFISNSVASDRGVARKILGMVRELDVLRGTKYEL